MYLYKKVIKELLEKKITVSTVESCTGGLLGAKFTSFPGISKIYKMGIITYSNLSKKSLLKISSQNLDKNGAVSYEVAKDMVINLNKISHTRLCISTTGIAGPSGGTLKKPVGLVFVGIKYKKKIVVIKKNFNGSRKKIQLRTINCIFKEIDKLI